MDWLSDVVKVAPEKRSKGQWRMLGQHHAQALVARHLSHMDPIEWAAYRRAVLISAEHEYKRTTGMPEMAYWMAYLWSLQITDRFTPRVLGEIRKCLQIVA